VPTRRISAASATANEPDLESATVRCPAGHFFNGPIEFLTYDKRESAAGGDDRFAQPADRGVTKRD